MKYKIRHQYSFSSDTPTTSLLNQDEREWDQEGWKKQGNKSKLAESDEDSILSDFSSFEGNQLEEAVVEEDPDIYTQLNRVNGWKLSEQCAVMRPQQQRQLELGDIANKAGRLGARRMVDQDYTPAHMHREQNLERVADELDDMSASDSRVNQRMQLSSQRLREMFLVSIAARLRRVDGCTQLVHSNASTPPTTPESPLLPISKGGGTQCQHQRALHPREVMRRSVLNSIDRLQTRLASSPSLCSQRFVR